MAGKGKVGRPEGGSSVENVRLNRRKKVHVNHEYARPRIRMAEPTNEPRKYYCCMCGHGFNVQKNNFPTGGKSPLWRGNGGYLPFCRSCCEILMESMTSFYSGNEEHALRHLCAMFDWYYSETASAMTLAQAHAASSRIAVYPSKMSTRQVSLEGETFLDTLRDEDEMNQQITDVEQVEDDENEGSEEFVVTRQMIRTWGKGFTPDQYQFLEEEYADWITKNVCNTKSQEEIYRNIALAQLDIRIARQTGGKVTDAQEALQKLMNSANILPRQTAENILADTQSFGTLLEKYERTRPIPEPAPEWRDVDGVRKYMNTWFRGGLSKALHVKSENATLYEEAVREMERHTVSRDNDSQSADGMGAAIFDGESAGEDGGEEVGDN